MNDNIRGAVRSAFVFALAAGFLVMSIQWLASPVEVPAPAGPERLISAPVGSAGAQLHVPPVDEIERQIRAAGQIGPDAGPDDVDAAVATWLAELSAVSPLSARVGDEARLLANERAVLSGEAVHAATPITASVLVLPVEFAAYETLTYQVHNADGSACITATQTFTGPLHGQVPYPGDGSTATIDNQTVYYPSTEPEDYERLIFSRTGVTEPVRAGDPNINDGAGVDLSGLTVQTYFDAQSDHTVEITGSVAPWIPVPHSEAYFGLPICIPGLSSRARPDEQLGSLAELTVLAAEGLKASGGEYGTYEFWKQFDLDGDGIIDALWVLHAGRGQDYGGGAQGEWSIWSQSSDVRYQEEYQDGYTIHDNGTPDPDDDVLIGPFVLDPEDSDIGVLIEEFGHSFFGLPDLYTTSASNSVGWWAPMSAGIWGGELGGSRPVNMPLWFRMVADCGGAPCGWADPVKVVTYTAAAETVILGQAGTPAGGTLPAGPYGGQTIYEGLRVELPEQLDVVPNRAGDGGGAYSGADTGLDLTMDRPLDLTAAAAPISLTMDAYWRIRRYWGYVYLEVSTDGGQSFASIPDLDGRFTADNPYGLNEGYGMTGDGEGELHFDLSAYAGQAIVLRLRHFTYQGAPNTGWWVDNLFVSGGVLAEDFEGGIGGWAAAGWTGVPLTKRHPHHYLVEWRSGNGFDKALEYAYSTSYYDEHEWRVDRVPANVPGAVVMYRNLEYPFSGAFLGQLNDPPSIGSKYGLLVVDTNFWPVERPSGEPFAGRLESLDAPLALQRQPDYALEVWDQATRSRRSTEQMAGRPGVARFDDAQGYYPGFYTNEQGDVLAWDQDASVVIPSRDDKYYSTRITHPDKSRPHPLDGTSAGGEHFYGSGDPGDDDAQLGVRIEVVGQAKDGSWGAIRINAEPVERSYVFLPVVVNAEVLGEGP